MKPEHGNVLTLKQKSDELASLLKRFYEQNKNSPSNKGVMESYVFAGLLKNVSLTYKDFAGDAFSFFSFSGMRPKTQAKRFTSIQFAIQSICDNSKLPECEQILNELKKTIDTPKNYDEDCAAIKVKIGELLEIYKAKERQYRNAIEKLTLLEVMLDKYKTYLNKDEKERAEYDDLYLAVSHHDGKFVDEKVIRLFFVNTDNYTKSKEIPESIASMVFFDEVSKQLVKTQSSDKEQNKESFYKAIDIFIDNVSSFFYDSDVVKPVKSLLGKWQAMELKARQRVQEQEKIKVDGKIETTPATQAPAAQLTSESFASPEKSEFSQTAVVEEVNSKPSVDTTSLTEQAKTLSIVSKTDLKVLKEAVIEQLKAYLLEKKGDYTSNWSLHVQAFIIGLGSEQRLDEETIIKKVQFLYSQSESITIQKALKGHSVCGLIEKIPQDSDNNAAIVNIILLKTLLEDFNNLTRSKMAWLTESWIMSYVWSQRAIEPKLKNALALFKRAEFHMDEPISTEQMQSDLLGVANAQPAIVNAYLRHIPDKRLKDNLHQAFINVQTSHADVTSAFKPFWTQPS